MTTAYITIPRDDAEGLATSLVEDRYAACVNRVPCQSTYVWDGTVERDAEDILIAKTTAARYADLAAYVREAHPHDVPCIERFDESDANDTYRDWVRKTVTP